MGGRAIRVAVVGVLAGSLLLGGPEARGAPSAEAASEAGSSDWVQVSAGGVHTCGIRTTGRLYCWGDNTYGQLGDGSTANRSTPTQVAGGATTWVQVTAGGNHTCARRSTGRLYCWGNDVLSQLGDGGTDTSQSTPVQVAGGATTWTQVTAGLYHTCARRSTGRLYCWGNDFYSQLGDGGTDTDQPTPVQVAGGATNWVQVTAGGDHTCGRRSTGRLFCWGRDDAGQLGDGGTDTDQPTPVQVAGGVTNWTVVASGYHHACARRSTGRLYCWGGDEAGQLGDGGTDTDQPTPVEVAGGATTWTHVSGGYNHTCARRSTGRLYCWGSDSSGQVGEGVAVASAAAPLEVAGGATDWSAVDVGDAHSCARITARRLFCWGYDNGGRLGDGGADTNRPVPFPVWA